MAEEIGIGSGRMTAAEEIRRLDARLERITRAAELVREWLRQEHKLEVHRESHVLLSALHDRILDLLAAIDGKPSVINEFEDRAKHSEIGGPGIGDV